MELEKHATGSETAVTFSPTISTGYFLERAQRTQPEIRTPSLFRTLRLLHKALCGCKGQGWLTACVMFANAEFAMATLISTGGNGFPAAAEGR